jgi:hypothetical protein
MSMIVASGLSRASEGQESHDDDDDDDDDDDEI